MAGSCEPSGSVSGGEFVDWMSGYQLAKNYSVPRI
jgi:hypothetical protein